MIVLDTHVLLWWASGERDRLSAKARRVIDRALDGGQIAVSTMSAWEIAMLVHRGRLDLAMSVDEWLAEVGRLEAVRFVSLDLAIALKSVDLPGEFHKDPADRMIVATARHLAAELVTADEKIRAYPHVRTVW